MGLLYEKIQCQRTLELIRKALLNPAMLNKTIIHSQRGTPQGSSISPVICNIVLHQFDLFIEKVKSKFEKGKIRKVNPKYHSLSSARIKSKNLEVQNNPLQKMLSMESRDLRDPNFKRLMYVRYADDFVILVIGSMSDCFDLRRKVKDYLQNKLGLELNVEKTNICNLQNGFEFLGAQINHRGKVFVNIQNLSGIRRRSVRRLSVLAPLSKLVDKLIVAGFARRNHLAMVLAKCRRDLVNSSHYEIIQFYRTRINGILSYYSFAGNFDQLRRVV
jgi:hypothetical protein